MGFPFSNLFSKKNFKILMLGLDDAGKTTILYQLKMSEFINTFHTIGFNLEELNYKNFKFSLWDVNGLDKIRAFWHHYYEKTDAIIFVVDCKDEERFELVNEVFSSVLNDKQLENACFLIFANKQDINGAIQPVELVNILDLGAMKNRKWVIKGCSGVSGQGVKEGFEWIANILINERMK